MRALRALRAHAIAVRVALLASVALCACGPSLAAIAERRAACELRCAPPALRVRPAGELRVRDRGQLRALVLFEASGCEREQLYVCARASSACAHDFAHAPWPELSAVFEREQALLRRAARARCPEAELRITQESESLFRFEACDGAWLYHCRANGCQRLSLRQ